MRIPGFVELERGVVKSVFDCTYPEFVTAMMRERNARREQQLYRFFSQYRKRWQSAPQVTIQELLSG